jgi:tRNA pseudouridine38-40 synthase
VKDLSKRAAVLVRFGYDGSRFWGLQPQPGLPTAGGALEARLHDAAGLRPRGLAFAARTDRGVHADANLATCFFVDDAGAAVDVAAVARAAAADRDDGLRDVAVFAVDPRVHARGVSRGKRYRYRLRGGVDVVDVDDDDALVDPRRWRVAPRLDVARMQAAADRLKGSHDFSSFRAGGCSAATPRKTLYRFDVAPDGDDVVVDLVGDAFVRKMVRNLIGLLAEIGAGWRDGDDVEAGVDAVLAARHRQAAGLCAPPQGLTLVAVGSAWPDDGSWLLPECPVVRDDDDA